MTGVLIRSGKLGSKHGGECRVTTDAEFRVMQLQEMPRIGGNPEKLGILILYGFQREHGPVDILTSDFQSRESEDHKFLLF